MPYIGQPIAWTPCAYSGNLDGKENPKSTRDWKKVRGRIVMDQRSAPLLFGGGAGLWVHDARSALNFEVRHGGESQKASAMAARSGIPAAMTSARIIVHGRQRSTLRTRKSGQRKKEYEDLGDYQYRAAKRLRK